MISLVVQGLDSMLPLLETDCKGEPASSLVGKLRSRKPGGTAKRKKYRNKPFLTWRGDIYRQIGLLGSLKCHYICSFPQVNKKPPGTQYPGISGLLTNISCHLPRSWKLFSFYFWLPLFFVLLLCVSCSVVSDSLRPRGLSVAHQAPLATGFSRQEYWSGLPSPSPGDLPNPGIEPGSLSLQEDSLLSEPPGKSY